MKKQLIFSIIVIAFLVVGTIVAVIYGEGYRFDFTNPKNFVKGTGLLVATSNPDGASVFVNGHLTTATNNTINLAPGDYTIKIFKDGYFSWQKQIKIDQEVVSKADALLFPTAPKLESVTTTGALHPVLDPSFTKIAFVVASQSAQQNGIYVFDMGNRSLLTLQGGATQIADETTGIDFSQAELSWSPDSKQIIAKIPSAPKPTVYLLDARNFNSTPKDVTETLASVETGWDQLSLTQTTARLNTLKPELRQFVMSSMTNLLWSPDQTKILYTASISATMSPMITPSLIGADSTPEMRTLQAGDVYLYDTKEDKNFLIAPADKAASEKIMWFPDSKHLIVVHDKMVDIREYDGTNNTTIYAGPFMDSDVFPWATPENLVILTNLGNPTIAANLYTVGLK